MPKSRNDQISKIMGEKLLSGNTMLGSNCGVCGSILMRSPNKVEFCIGCDIDVKQVRDANNRNNSNNVKPETSDDCKLRALKANNDRPSDKKICKSMEHTRNVLTSKIQWATSQLENSTDVISIVNLSKIIKESAQAISALDDIKEV